MVGMRKVDHGRRLVHGTALLSLALVAAAVAVAPWRGVRPDPGDTSSWLSQFLGALVFGYVGAVIADRTAPPLVRVGTVLQVTGLSQAATLFTSSYLHRAAALHWPGTAAVRWLDSWLWAPGVLCVLAVFPLLYPAGDALPRLRGVLRAGIALTGVGTAAIAFQALPSHRHIAVLGPVVVAATAGCALAGVASLVVRYRRGDPRTREQVRWLAAAVVLIVIFEPLQAALPEPVATAGLTVLPLLVPVAVGIAVLRHGLYDIDLLVTRTLAYVVLCTLLVGLYIGVVVAASHELAGAAVQMPALVAAVVVALLANPARTRVQQAISRWLWGPSAEPQQLLAELAHQLGSSPSLRHAPQAVVDTVAAAFRAPYVEMLATPEDGPPTVVARAGTGFAGPVVHTPVEYGGRVVGMLSTGRTDSPEPREVHALRQVAVALGPVLDGWLVTSELQRSRERVVSAREAERTRLHRDLHDGVGPTLGGIALGVQAAHNLVRTDPQAAESVLTRLSELAGQATADVRALVDGLRPAALETHGLVGAIRRATELEGSGPVVQVHAEAVDHLPPAVEVAALRIVLEAVNNVRRHARASRCDVRLCFDGDAVLSVLVDDDGIGIERRTRTGVGLESIAARAGELGGVARVGLSPLGGTRVLARIPVGADGE